MKKLSCLLIIIVIISCNKTDTLNKEEITAAVSEMLYNYHYDIKKDGLIAEFKYLDSSSDFYWVPPGYSEALTYDSVKSILESNHKAFRSISFDWDTLQVFPLTNTIANYSGIVRGLMVDTAGFESTVRIIESGTLIKRKDGWKLLSGQSAMLNSPAKPKENVQPSRNSKISLMILGTVQDAGSPHIGCKTECCKSLFEKADPNRMVVSLGLIDHNNKKNYLIEATPDISRQMKLLKAFSNAKKETPSGIFLTHAHIGHYSGLMYLGKEALGANEVPVYAMPRMKSFLQNNGPWDQLIKQKNIAIQNLSSNKTVQLSNELNITPFTVPHRDEYSETVGYKIQGPNKSVLFIPDIDKWEKWKLNIIEEISKVDYAFLDATFYDGEEINNRDISEIPHPFIIESMELFKKLDQSEKSKIHFIHFNHTNPALMETSKRAQQIIKNGFNIARIRSTFEL